MSGSWNKPWLQVVQAIAALRRDNFKWINNPRFKYIRINIDTRDWQCSVTDRDGKPIDSLAELYEGDNNATLTDSSEECGEHKEALRD